MKKDFWIGFIILGVIALVFLGNKKYRQQGGNEFTNEPAPSAAVFSNPPVAPTTNAPPGTAGMAASSGGSVVPAPVAARAGELVTDTNVAGDLPPATVLRNVRRAVREYCNMFGGDPVGINSEITAALAGDNPKHINFIDPSAGMRLNSKGELVDEWGTPYFFHQLSGTEMEIHSAGPDRIMWTSDDLVTK